MKKITLSFVLIYGLFNSAWAQPVLTAANFNPSPGETFQLNTYKPASSCATIEAGASGANVVWDFSKITPSGSLTNSIVSVSSTPYASNFAGSTIGQKNTTSASSNVSFNYFVASTSEYALMGIEDNLSKLFYSDTKIYLKYPMSYQDNFQDQINSSTSYTNTSNGTNVTMGNVSVVADGYGKLMLPGNTYNNVLRVRYVLSKDTNYVWFCPNTHHILLDINYQRDKNGSTIKNGEYLQSNTTGLNISGQKNSEVNGYLFPNPAVNHTQLQYEVEQTSQVVINIVDALGKVIPILNQKQNKGYHNQIIDVSNLAKGLYFVQIGIDGKERTSKLIIEDH